MLEPDDAGRLAPDVSFAIACYNALPYLDEAVASALAQEGVSLEVLIVDDGSTDGSLERARDWGTRDPRVRVLRTPRNLGPGGARNLAIEAMRGDWYAVLDSDDRIAPGRSRALIDAAERLGADLAADDLEIFGEAIEPHRFLTDPPPPDGAWIDPTTYFAATRMFGASPNLGFLKPMIRRRVLERTGIRYDPSLRIGEDDALIVQLLLAGARYRLMPQAGYFYRKHGSSISHRLSLDHAERMMASERQIRAAVAERPEWMPAYRPRYAAMRRALAFTRAIDALKRGRPAEAATAIARRPDAARLFAMPIRARWNRLFARR